MTSQIDRAHGASSAGARLAAQARFETRTLLANGEQLLVAMILPALALVALAFTSVPDLGAGRRIDVAVPGVLALCLLSTAFTGQAIQTAFDRRYGVLRLLGSTPLGRGGLLGGKVAAVLVVEALQALVIGGLGLALGWHPEPAGFALAVISFGLGTWAFVALALLLAGALRPEAVLAVANLVWVLLLGVGGVLLPARELPGSLAAAVPFLPSAALADALRAGFLDGAADLRSWVVLAAWALVATAIARRTFRWSA